MALKVRVRNFQSLKDAHLEIHGLTAVTGPNNSGKSALMRAIRGVFQNTPGSYFVRYGTEEAIVDIEFGDGRKLTWKKGKKPCYVIDNGTPIYPGRGVPDEVRAFGVLPITAGGQEVWPTLAQQFGGQVFLMDQPGSALAEAVADVERVTKLTGALRNAESDKRSTQATLKVRREDESRYKEKLKTFDGLDTILEQVTTLELAADKANRMARAIGALYNLQNRLQTAEATVQALAPAEDIGVPTVAETDKCLQSLGTLEVLSGLHKRLGDAQSQVAILQGVEGIEVPDAGDLQTQQGRLVELQGLAARFESAHKTVDALAGSESVGVDLDVAPTEKLLAAMDVCSGLQRRYLSAVQVVAEVEAELMSLQKEADDSVHEVHQALGTFSECPTCGQGMAHA